MVDGQVEFVVPGVIEKSIFGTKVGSESCKSEPTERSGVASPLCPQCKSKRVWRAAHRYSVYGDKIQRWLCRDCGLRFSDPEDVKNSWSTQEKTARTQLSNDIKMATDIVTSSQICVKETKNLGPEQIIQQVPERRIDINGKLVQFAWKMQQEGYTEDTARVSNCCLKSLITHGADLADPTSVKDVLAKGQWTPSRKHNLISAYTLFLKFNEMSWTRPKCHVSQTFPFIPSEQEIDALIAASCKKHTALLSLLKETGMRVGEARRLKWTDIDRERNIITLNAPEKRSLPRMWRVTPLLIEMLNGLPKKGLMLFTGAPRSMEATLKRTRRRLAQQL